MSKYKITYDPRSKSMPYDLYVKEGFLPYWKLISFFHTLEAAEKYIKVDKEKRAEMGRFPKYYD